MLHANYSRNTGLFHGLRTPPVVNCMGSIGLALYSDHHMVEIRWPRVILWGFFFHPSAYVRGAIMHSGYSHGRWTNKRKEEIKRKLRP